MEGLDWWPWLPEFQTFLDEQTLLPLTSAEGEECDDEVGHTDDEYGVDDAVDDGHGVGDDDESRIVKAGNMRRGDVGDTGVFPREYQSRTSAPRPRKCYKLQENGTFASTAKEPEKPSSSGMLQEREAFGEVTSKSGIVPVLCLEMCMDKHYHYREGVKACVCPFHQLPFQNDEMGL